MAKIPYQIMCLQSETDQKQVLAAGKSDMTRNSTWDSQTMEVIEPTDAKRVPWGLQDYIVYWNIVTGEYDQGDEIIKESGEITDYIADNDVWTDSVTGIKGRWDQVQLLALRREIYGENDADNPLHVDGLQGLIPCATNINTIHGKLGWHNVEIQEAKYHRPADLLVYYGWMNSFNSAENGWDNEKVAQEMARYKLIVLGDGIQDSGHGDYANTSIIIPRIKALNPCCKIFGYATANQIIGDFQTKVSGWNTLGVHGIFMDEAGYDYGTNDRASFNIKVDYVHGQSSANLCFVNAWNQDHIIGVVDDPSYPNSTKNPSAVESNLTHNDWYLSESHPVNTTAYPVTGGYQAKGDWAIRGVKAIGHRATYGINIAACGIINDDNVNGQDLFDFAFIAALMFSLDGFGISDTSYGSGSAKTKWWTRPDVFNLGHIGWLNPSVQIDIGDTNVYHRYAQFGRLSVDFSSSAQSSIVVKW